MLPFQFRGGMRSKILSLILVPVLSISVILSWYFMTARQADLATSLQRLGNSIVQNLAAASDLAMFAGDLESLQRVAKFPSQAEAVQGLAFVAADGSTLLALGQFDPRGAATMPEESSWLQGEFRGDQFWYFRAAVELDTGTMADYDGADDAGSQMLGWVVIAISLDEFHQTRLDNFVIGSALAILITLLVSSAAWLFGQRIYQPVRDLTDIVKTMESGDLTAQAKLAGEVEVQILARVVNQLASTLRETNVRLEREIGTATQDLTQALADLEHRNRDLVAVGEQLEQAMGAKDQLLARMSHELRTPLTAIIGFARRLDSSSRDSEQAVFRDAIYHSSVLLSSIIDDILDFSKLEYSDIALESRAFNLENALDDIVAMHAYTAYEKAVELVLFIDSDVPRMYLGDAVRFKQIVNNLLANAIKFTDSGEVVVHVGRCEDDGQTTAAQDMALEVSVRDSGIGIAVADLDNLFKPFSQADTSIHRRFGGSGLGLVICRQLVERMGGQISVDSELGKGTTFHFTVKLALAGAGFDEPDTPQRLDVVAIIDRNRWSRRSLRSQVAHCSRQVFAVAHRDELITLLRDRQVKPTAVLINICADAAQNQPFEARQLEAALAAIRDHYAGVIIVLNCGPAGHGPIPERLFSQYPPLQQLSKPVRRTKLLESLVAASGATVEEVQDDADTTQPAVSPGQLAGVDVLLAEDNKYNQVLLRTLLETQGANVMIANNGAEAIECFATSACQLVIMDAHMPVVDGAEASRQIMSSAARAGQTVVVIVLTADTTEKQRERLLDAGVSEVLYKPVDEELLIRTLCRHAGLPYTEADTGGIIEQKPLAAELQKALREQTEKLRRAVNDGLFTDAHEAVHQLLGIAGLYGMIELRQMVIELDKNLTLRQTTSVRRGLVALETLIDNITQKDFD